MKKIILAILVSSSFIQNRADENSFENVYNATLGCSAASAFIIGLACNLSSNKIKGNTAGLMATAGTQALINNLRETYAPKIRLTNKVTKTNPATNVVFGSDVQMYAAATGYTLGAILGNILRSSADSVGNLFSKKESK